MTDLQEIQFTKKQYDNLGRLLSLTDPVGNTTSYEYDSQRHVVKETNALEKSRYFEYLGRWLIRKTDRNGRVIEYIYDRFGRQKEERWLEGKKTVKIISNTYNELGDLIEIQDELNSFTYEYNALRLETKSSVKVHGLNKEIVLKSEYDRQGQRILSESQEFSTQYTYTPNRFIESITQGDKSVQYNYDVTGQRISAKTPAVITTYQYDGMGRLIKLDHDNIAQYNYQWDVANQILAINDGRYNYDKTNQLITANYEKLPSEKYIYDLNGNRSNYRTGKNNQLLHDGENFYEYDGEGNRISKGTTKYFWDHRNRLVKVETPQEMVEYVYDYKNRLIKRSTSKGSEYFVHDGWQIVLMLDNNSSVTNKFLWSVKQDELIAQNSAYALCDHLGTIRDLIGNGIAAHFEYNAFGQLLSKIGNTDSVFKYTGKMTDEVTSLQWNINRWYDAKTGRWISEDPIGFQSNDLNLYRFINNSPFINVDPSGKILTSILAIANSQGMVVAGSVGTFITLAQIVSYFSMPNTNIQIPANGFRDISFSIGTWGATLEQRYERWEVAGTFCPHTVFVDLTIRFYDADAFSNDDAFSLAPITSAYIGSLNNDRTFAARYGQELRLTCRNTSLSTCVTISDGNMSSEVCDPWPWSTVDLYYEYSVDYFVSGSGGYDISEPINLINHEHGFIGYFECN
jgi:RHS repeat-associated protein